MHRVKNEYGPQTKGNYTDALGKLMENTSPAKIKADPDALPIGIRERLTNAEKCLNIKSEASKTIYERLKLIENRILHLEALSPEYTHFLVNLMFMKRKVRFTYSLNRVFFLSVG